MCVLHCKTKNLSQHMGDAGAQRGRCVSKFYAFDPHNSASPHASPHKNGYVSHDPQTSGSPAGTPSSHMARQTSSSQVRCHGDNSWITTQSMNGCDTCLSLRFCSHEQTHHGCFHSSYAYIFWLFKVHELTAVVYAIFYIYATTRDTLWCTKPHSTCQV